MSTLNFNTDNVRLNQHADSWEEAIGMGVQLLIDNGHAQPCYLDKIIANIKELGPYIVIAENFAMPHARPEDGAVSYGCSLVTLDEPVMFETKPAQVILSFTAENNDSHIDLLQKIVALINDGKIKDIAQAQSLEDLNTILD